MSVRPANVAGFDATRSNPEGLSLDFLTTGSSDLNRILKAGAQHIRARNMKMKVDAMKTASSAPVVHIMGTNDETAPFKIEEHPSTAAGGIADYFTVVLVNKHDRKVAVLQAQLDDRADYETCGCVTNFKWQFLENYNPNVNRFGLMTPDQIKESDQTSKLSEFDDTPTLSTTFHGCNIKARLINTALYAERYAFYMLARHMEFWLKETLETVDDFDKLPVKPTNITNSETQKTFFTRWQQMIKAAYTDTANMRTEVSLKTGGFEEFLTIGYENDGSDGRLPYPPPKQPVDGDKDVRVLRLNRKHLDL